VRECVHVIEKPALAAGITVQNRGQAANGFTISLNLGTKGGYVFLSPTIMVITHRPNAERAPTESPKLLWYPEKTIRVFVRSQGKSIADDVNSEILQSQDCGLVERMCGCNPDMGRHSFALENLNRLLQFGFLLRLGKTSKFAVRRNANNAAIVTCISVLVPVQTDSPSSGLPLADLLPEFVAWRTDLQHGVLIVRDDGENWSQFEFKQNTLDPGPYVPVHSGTQIIEADYIRASHVRSAAKH